MFNFVYDNEVTTIFHITFLYRWCMTTSLLEKLTVMPVTI